MLTQRTTSTQQSENAEERESQARREYMAQFLVTLEVSVTLKVLKFLLKFLCSVSSVDGDKRGCHVLQVAHTSL
jgi:hypothetical protein